MTRITLEEPRAAGYPVVKRTALGQLFTGAVLKTESRDRLKRGDDGNMTPIVKPNGNHAQELVVTCLTLPGTTALAGLGDTEGVPAPGDIVRLILKGKAFGDWIEAKKTLPRRGVAVGDVVTQLTKVAQVYDAQGTPAGPELTDQASVDAARAKGRSVGIYGSLTLREPQADSEWTDRAVAAYRALQEPIPAEPVIDFNSPPYTPEAAPATPAPNPAPAPSAAAAPVKPEAISQAAWDQMDASTKARVNAAIPF